jgi:sec-independent protein translocase protein TatC
MKLFTIFRAIIYFVIFIGSFFFADNIIRLIKSSIAIDLITKSPSGGFILFMQVATIVTITLLFPFIIYEIIRYIKPALYKKEKDILSKILKLGHIISMLFLLGVAFGVYVIFEIILPFLIEFNSTVGITNIWDANTTIMFVLLSCFYSGIIFQTPIVIYLLLSWGILDIKNISTIRKVIIVVALVLGAFITPPDIFSQLIFGFPIWVLFEISVIVWRVKNARNN